MIAFGKDDSLREGWMDGKNGMIPAGLDGKGKTEGRGQTTEVRGQGDGWMNRMTGWKKAGSKDLRFRSTFDIIAVAEKGLLPDKIMLNTHPQRWTDNPVEWMKELVWQNFKNFVKRGMIAWRQG